MFVPSTNYLYKPGIRGGRFPYLYKVESVVAFQEELITQGNASGLVKIRDLTISSPAYTLSLVFLIRDRFWSRDVSNMVKASEDALVEVIGIDDSRAITVTATKERQIGKKEGIGITIELQYS